MSRDMLILTILISTVIVPGIFFPFVLEWIGIVGAIGVLLVYGGSVLAVVYRLHRRKFPDSAAEFRW